MEEDRLTVLPRCGLLEEINSSCASVTDQMDADRSWPEVEARPARRPASVATGGALNIRMTRDRYLGRRLTDRETADVLEKTDRGGRRKRSQKGALILMANP